MVILINQINKGEIYTIAMISLVDNGNISLAFLCFRIFVKRKLEDKCYLTFSDFPFKRVSINLTKIFGRLY